MNVCIFCGERHYTGCMCTAKVAKSKPVDGGNVNFPEVEIEPLCGWEMAIVWTSILVIGVYGVALIATGLIALYQQILPFINSIFN